MGPKGGLYGKEEQRRKSAIEGKKSIQPEKKKETSRPSGIFRGLANEKALITVGEGSPGGEGEPSHSSKAKRELEEVLPIPKKSKCCLEKEGCEKCPDKQELGIKREAVS